MNRFADKHLVGKAEGYSARGTKILKWILKNSWDSVARMYLAQDRRTLNCCQRGEKFFTEMQDVL